MRGRRREPPGYGKPPALAPPFPEWCDRTYRQRPFALELRVRAAMGPNRTSHKHVVGGLINRQGAVKQRLEKVKGDGGIRPSTVERVHGFCQPLYHLDRAFVLLRLWGDLGSRCSDNTKGAQFTAVQADHEVHLLSGAGSKCPGGRFTQHPSIHEQVRRVGSLEPRIHKLHQVCGRQLAEIGH